MNALQAIVTEYNEEISRELKRFSLPEVGVSDKIEYRDVSEFEGRLIFAEPGITDDAITLLLSSEGASFNGKKVTTILNVETLEGSLFTDQNREFLGTNFFYISENGKIIPVQTSSPIRIDAFNPFLENILTWYTGPRDVLLTGPLLHNITVNKIKTKEILSQENILIPAYHEITGKDLSHLYMVIENFLQNNNISDFVVKADESNRGENVRMFKSDEIWQAVNYTRDVLLSGNKSVYLDERINPLPWKNEGGKDLDWNLRTFVSAGDSPIWIDGLVRYNDRNGQPVNISQGAKVVTLEEIARTTGVSLDDIQTTSLQIATILSEYVRQKGEEPTGFFGFDLMVSQKGIYLIEANDSRSGGFAELMEMRKDRLYSVSHHLIGSLGPFLSRNRQKTNGTINWKHIPAYIKSPASVAALLMLNNDNVDEAMTLYTKALEQNPKYHELFLSLSECSKQQGNYISALHYLDMLLTKNPNHDRALFEKGLNLHLLGQHEKAIEFFQTCIALGNVSSHIRSFYGYSLAQTGKIDEGMIILTDILAKDPECFMALVHLGQLHTQREEYDSGIIFTRKALELEPENYHLRLNLALYLSHQGDVEASLHEFNHVIREAPLDKEAHNQKGKVLFDHGRFEEAVQAARDALAIDPYYDRASTGLVLALTELRHYAEAQQHLVQRLQRSPGDAKLHFSLAHLFHLQECYTLAIPYYREAVRLDPNAWNPHFLYADLLSRLGQSSEAETHFKAAVYLHPGSSVVHTHYAANLLSQDRLTDAKVHLQKAQALEPDDPYTHLVLGKYFLMDGDYGEAAKHFQQVPSDHEHFLGALVGLAVSYHHSGKNRMAIRKIWDAYDIAPQLYQGPLDILETSIDHALRKTAADILKKSRRALSR